MNIQLIDISQVKPNPNNPRIIKDYRFDKLVKSIQDFPEMLKLRPIVVDNNFMVLGGNMRLKSCEKAGHKKVYVIKADDLTEEQKKEFIIKDNLGYGEWDTDILANEWDNTLLDEWGLELEKEFIVEDDAFINARPKKLIDRFLIPPFSVLDTKLGQWQQRKNWWLDLGIKSELGREGGLTFGKSAQSPRYYDLKNEMKAKGLPADTDSVFKEAGKRGIKLLGGENGSTSIFDPVLCELSYLWFNTQNGKILDPFAGGSVRGIVASKLGFKYYGNDLRKEQVEANIKNYEEVSKVNDVIKNKNLRPTWTYGDSKNIDEIFKGEKFDLLFSCPPYADLEVYSDDPADLSNMPYDEFKKTYFDIINKSCGVLNENRFAVFVVADVRNKNGSYKNFVSYTIECFEKAGLSLYNEMILVNHLASLPIRVGSQFSKSRKAGKHHQNVLVFYKGDTTKIAEHFPVLDLSYLENLDTETLIPEF